MPGENHVTNASEVTNMKKRIKRLPTYRKRVFLNHISTGLTPYIFFEVDSSQNGKYPLGNYILRIADCEASLFFEFGLTSKHRRRESLKKRSICYWIL